ncbi:flagellar hook assembly protein FlgD [Acidimangrovimonas pyrenivorans]|uniref:Basal-body rod modification protein FlgD n=1 Tax=Acidimangrovimonas pyrenivorans TaxID=2030798 RepID=A0ABV7ANV5_9RHOB
MAIDSTTSATSTTASQTSSAAASKQIGADYNSFLKLLTAQIANQDPLKPMDSTQFVSQLAQLSQVEQTVQSNANLEKISSTLGALASMSDVGLMGRSVTLASDRIELQGGAGHTAYQLASTAASATARITDAAGNVVRTIPGLGTDGGSRIALDWDGKDDSGKAVADGVYHVTIDAKDSNGDAVSYDTYPTTTVEKVLFGSNGQVLELGNGEQILSSQILSVS